MEQKERITIRQGIFESNSSSSHSIFISNTIKDGLMDTIVPDSDGNIHIRGDEFGWEQADYNDAYTKVSYLSLDVTNMSQTRRDKINTLLNEEETPLMMLTRIIKEQTGATSVTYDFDGYIDHQSHGTTEEAFRSDEALRNFIFNPESVLTTDNDNH